MSLRTGRGVGFVRSLLAGRRGDILIVDKQVEVIENSDVIYSVFSRCDLSIFHLDRIGRRQKGQIEFHCVRDAAWHKRFYFSAFEFQKVSLLLAAYS